MNKIFIKMLTVSALSLTMLFGASFATSENMTELNSSISIEDGADFIVIDGSEYISSDKLVEIGVSITVDQTKVIVGENNKTYKIKNFGSNEAIKVKNKIYLPFKDIMLDNNMSFEYTTNDTMLVRNATSTFIMYAQKEDRPSEKLTNANQYVKMEMIDLTEAEKIDLEKKIKAEKLILASEMANVSAEKIVEAKVVNKNSLVKFQNTVYIYSKELRNLNVETRIVDGNINVLNTKNDIDIDLTIKDVMYISGQGGADCLLPAVRVLDELGHDYTIDFDNSKIEIRNADGNVYYTFE